MVHDLVPGPIESRRQRNFGNGHAHAVREALAQRPCGRLDAWSLSILRMTRRATAPLAKPLQLLKGQVETGHVKQSVEQCAPVTGRQNETVAVWPVRIAWVELERPVPKGIRHGCRSHGQPRMARVGLLHHIDCQKTQRVDAQLIQSGRSSDRCKSCSRCHGAFLPFMVANG